MMASKNSRVGRESVEGEAQGDLGVLGKWRNVVKVEDQGYFLAQNWYDRELLAFLQAGRVSSAHVHPDV
jgi:hypothetical protein